MHIHISQATDVPPKSVESPRNLKREREREILVSQIQITDQTRNRYTVTFVDGEPNVAFVGEKLADRRSKSQRQVFIFYLL